MAEVAGGTKKRGGGSTVSAVKVYAKIWDDLETFNSLPREEKLMKLSSDRNGYCVAKNITLKQFNTRVKKDDGAGCFRMEFRKEKGEATGKAWIYELPHGAHEGAAGEVLEEITTNLGLSRKDFIKGFSPRCAGPGDDGEEEAGSMEPDAFLGLKRLPSLPPGHRGAADDEGNRYPSLIVFKSSTCWDTA